MAFLGLEEREHQIGDSEIGSDPLGPTKMPFERGKKAREAPGYRPNKPNGCLEHTKGRGGI